MYSPRYYWVLLGEEAAQAGLHVLGKHPGQVDGRVGLADDRRPAALRVRYRRRPDARALAAKDPDVDIPGLEEDAPPGRVLRERGVVDDIEARRWCKEDRVKAAAPVGTATAAAVASRATRSRSERGTRSTASKPRRSNTRVRAASLSSARCATARRT